LGSGFDDERGSFLLRVEEKALLSPLDARHYLWVTDFHQNRNRGLTVIHDLDDLLPDWEDAACPPTGVVNSQE
jgi:hypothetical protein